MKSRLIIVLFVLCAFLSACHNPKASLTMPANPFYDTLVGIDSLMWHRPDSAWLVLMEYEGDSNVFNSHYAQLLHSELLFKKYRTQCTQTNQTELLQTAAYFDSLVQQVFPLQMDARRFKTTPTPNNDLFFLTARAHYSCGAGYFVHDSLIEACGEYIRTLQTMENHYTEAELVGTKARFMALAYDRLLDLFRVQFMIDPAIYCSKQAIAYEEIGHSSPQVIANELLHLGNLFGIQREYDSAVYYFEKTLEVLPDRNNLLYRDCVSVMALLRHEAYKDTETSLDSLKSVLAQAPNEVERTVRCQTIGHIYYDNRQYDSAKVYLEPVFEKDPVRAAATAQDLYEIAIHENDTMKANQYARFLVDEDVDAVDNQILNSRLNEIFQNYLREKQEIAAIRQQKKAIKTTLAIALPLVGVLAVVVVILMRCRHRKRLAIQEAEAQRQLNEASQRLSEAAQRLDEAERELQTKVEQATQLTREMLLQRVADIYQSNNKNKLQCILETLDETYPQVVARLKAEHPELGETERNILLLNFLHFRIKEEADLLGLKENTVMKYRSDLIKKVGKSPVSDLLV